MNQIRIVEHYHITTTNAPVVCLNTVNPKLMKNSVKSKNDIIKSTHVLEYTI